MWYDSLIFESGGRNYFLDLVNEVDTESYCLRNDQLGLSMYLYKNTQGDVLPVFVSVGDGLVFTVDYGLLIKKNEGRFPCGEKFLKDKESERLTLDGLFNFIECALHNRATGNMPNYIGWLEGVLPLGGMVDGEVNYETYALDDFHLNTDEFKLSVRVYLLGFI